MDERPEPLALSGGQDDAATGAGRIACHRNFPLSQKKEQYACQKIVFIFSVRSAVDLVNIANMRRPDCRTANREKVASPSPRRSRPSGLARFMRSPFVVDAGGILEKGKTDG